MDFETDFEGTEAEEMLTPEIPITTPTEPISKNYQGMLFMWVMFCVMTFFWFVKKLFRGRTKMRTDFVTIEEQLKRLQMSLESKDKVLQPDKFDEALNSLTSMTSLDPVQEQDGAQDGDDDVEDNGNKEESVGIEKIVEDENIGEAVTDNLEEKKNI